MSNDMTIGDLFSNRPGKRPNVDTPLMRAARETNARSTDFSMEEMIEWLGLGLTFDEYYYIARQRAIVACAVTFFGHNMNMGDSQLDERIARKVLGHEHWPMLGMNLILAYIDGMAIGWHGNRLATGRFGVGKSTEGSEHGTTR